MHGNHLDPPRTVISIPSTLRFSFVSCSTGDVGASHTHATGPGRMVSVKKKSFRGTRTGIPLAEDVLIRSHLIMY